mgnify:FL=1
MQVTETAIPGVLLLTPRVFEDERGFFLESYNRRRFEEIGLDMTFVQDNHSKSVRNVLRGLHYQTRQIQGKLVRVIAGEIFDVAVDLRRDSPTLGKWVGATLSSANRQILWVPPGFAHGFLTLTDSAEVFYKTTDYYAPAHERCVRWDDPQLAIRWPLQGEPLLSPKDLEGAALAEAELFS